MRKASLILVMLTIIGISANLTVQEASGQEGDGAIIDHIISDSEIVIGDTTFRIDPDAEFYAADRKTIVSLNYFKAGDAVEFILNDNGEIITLSKSTGQ